jgi:RNA polymerase sigma factor (sigma-70 family)
MTKPLTPQDSTHVSLLHRLSADPKTAEWQEFHDRYSQLITSYCRRTGLSGFESEDLIQEVFQALLKTLPSFHYVKAKGGFRAYLWWVVRNHALALRKKKLAAPKSLQPVVEESLESASNPDDIWEEEWRKHHLRVAFEQLSKRVSPSQLEVFHRYAIEDRPVAEVAQLSNCSVDMVYKTKSLLMVQLRKLIACQIELEG